MIFLDEERRRNIDSFGGRNLFLSLFLEREGNG